MTQDKESTTGQGLSVHVTHHISCTNVLPVEISSLNRSIHPTCLCFHPDLPLMGMGVPGFVGVFDLVTGCRTGRTEIRATPLEICFSNDGSLLVIATMEWHILGVNTTSWRPWRLCPRTDKQDKSLEHVHLAVSGGSRPVVFFCKHGKDAVRMAYAVKQVQKDAKGREVKEKDSKWGTKLKMDVTKPIMGLAAHPSDPTLVVLHADGVLRVYTLNAGGAAALMPTHAVPVAEGPGNKANLQLGRLQVVAHPLVLGGALLLHSSRGGSVSVLEMVGRSEPRPVIMAPRTGLPVIGLGVVRDAACVVAVLKADGVPANLMCWQLTGSAQRPGSVTATPAPADPPNLTNLLKSSWQGATPPPPREPAQQWQQLWSPKSSWQSSMLDCLPDLYSPEVASVAFHARLGVAAVQMAAPRLLRTLPGMLTQPAAQLTPMEALQMQRSGSVPVLRLLGSAPPLVGWHGAVAVPQHTPLDFWTSQLSPNLVFNRNVYFLTPSTIHKYALASKSLDKFTAVPTSMGDATPLSPSHMVASASKGAWIVFMHSGGGSKDKRDAAWHWTLVRETNIGYSDGVAWFKPGQHGVFLGTDDANFAILSENGSQISVFGTESTGPKTQPLYTTRLERSGAGSPLLPGPPAAAAPTGQEGAVGGGVVMWQTNDGFLAMGTLPGGAGDTGGRAAGRGIVRSERLLKLLKDERLLNASWQVLLPAALQEPYSCAAAVLTTHRLMLVSGDLRLLAQATVPTNETTAGAAIQSCLWVGPALLYVTAAGRVMQLCWTGQSVHVCSIVSGPFTVLAGALADCLLLLRETSSSCGWEASSRYVNLLQPLVLGWSSLAASGLLPQGLVMARNGVKAAVERYDCSQVAGGTVWTLMDCMAGDLAAVLADRSPFVEDSDKLAANAAAGKWAAVTTTLLAEHAKSVFAPGPATRGSDLHMRLVAAATGACRHGQFVRAMDCLKAAGEWEAAMVLAVARSDFEALRLISTQAAALPHQNEPDQAHSGLTPAEIGRLARSTVVAYPGQEYSVAPHDWQMRWQMPDGSPLELADQWVLAGTGAAPPMETAALGTPQQLIHDGEIGTLSPATLFETNSLMRYLGILNAQPVTARDAERARRSTNDSDGNALSEFDFGAAAADDVESSTGSETSKHLSRSNSRSLADNAKAKEQDDFYSDQEDEAEAEETSNKRKFKIQIRSKEEIAQGGGVGKMTMDLKEAASKLKLGALSLARSPRSFGRSNIPAVPEDTDDPFGGALGYPSTSAPKPSDTSFTSFPVPLPPPAQMGLAAAFAPAPFGSGIAGPSRTAPAPAPRLPPPGSGAQPGAGGSLLDDDPFAFLPPGPSAPAPAPGSLDDLFFSTPTAASAPRLAPPAASQQPQRPPPTGVSASAPIDLDDLLGIKPTKPPPPPPPVAPQPSAPRLAPPPQPAAQPVPSAPPAPGAGGMTSLELYKRGVQCMEVADWANSQQAFSRALAALESEPRTGTHAQRVSFCAQYYFAARLLGEAGSGNGPREARLYRFAAALKLDEEHQAALARESVQRNKAVGNYKYAADMLTTMITKGLGVVPMEVLAKLQETIDECDRAGGRNAALPADENTEFYAEVVAGATNAADLDGLVDSVLQG